VALVLLGTACGDGSGPRQPSLNDLVGTWTIQVWEYALAAKPDSTLDWVSFRALHGTLSVTATGAFTVTPALPGGFGSDDGTLIVSGDALYWDGQNDEEWVHFDLTGSQLTLYWPEVELVDMDHDGEPEDVRLRVVLRRL
jgi:hypothetical protein